MPEQKTQNQGQSIGALIVIIIAAIAIIAALVIGGIKLVGGDPAPEGTSEPTSGTLDPNDTGFKTVAWPSEKPLSSYSILGGSLILPTSDYTPATKSLQTIENRDTNGTHFLLSTTDLKIDKTANKALLAMTEALNNECTFNGSLLVHTVYTTTGDVEYRSGLTVRFRLSESGTFKYLSEASGDNPVEWLAENAWKFGFILRYPAGTTIDGKEEGVRDIYRYVGIPHAYYITHELAVEGETADGDEITPSLEDYVAAVKKATVKQPLACNIAGLAADNGLYNMYYVPAADVDKATIRENSKIYAISGDGAGYIVTTLISYDEDKPSGEKGTEDASSTEETDA